MNNGGRRTGQTLEVRLREQEERESDPINGPESKRRRLAEEAGYKSFWNGITKPKQNKQSDVFVLDESEVHDHAGVLVHSWLRHSCARAFA
jgi:hypothetical protein